MVHYNEWFMGVREEERIASSVGMAIEVVQRLT
jgi:hypothetical protein